MAEVKKTDMNRFICHFEGDNNQPTLLFVCGIHGNEPMSVLAMEEVLEEMNEEMHEELIKTILDNLRLLDPEELELLEMRYFEKRSYPEIGEILGIAENNAKVKTFRVVGKLKKAFQPK